MELYNMLLCISHRTPMLYCDKVTKTGIDSSVFSIGLPSLARAGLKKV